MEQNRGDQFGGKRALPVGLVVNGSSVKREQIKVIWQIVIRPGPC